MLIIHELEIETLPQDLIIYCMQKKKVQFDNGQLFK